MGFGSGAMLGVRTVATGRSCDSLPFDAMVMVSSEVSLGIGIAIRLEPSHTRRGDGYGLENVRHAPTLTHSRTLTDYWQAVGLVSVAPANFRTSAWTSDAGTMNDSYS